MTRMKLNPCASPIQNSSACLSAFKTIFIVVVVYWVLNPILGFSVAAGTKTTTTTTTDPYGQTTDPYGQTTDPYGQTTDPYVQTTDHTENTTELWVGGGLNVVRTIIAVAYAAFFLILSTLTRAYIRRKYNIPEGFCGPCDDFCCSFWCGTCSVCQMARHTADYASFPAACCTETGLLQGAPEVV
jgi:Cys-rich protein (TIGR01571 family)